jgi:DNA-binding transcriptional MocR family regulator
MITRAVEHGVIYVAGEAFFVNAPADGLGRNIVRLSFSAPAPDRIREGVVRLAATVRAELEAITLSERPVPSAAAPPRRAAP